MTNKQVFENIGEQSILNHLKTIYPNQDGIALRSVMPHFVAGQGPIQYLLVFLNEATEPHWHYVAFGSSELNEKESPNLDVNGWGLEFTFRLKKGDEDTPPMWVFNLIQVLANYIETSHNVFDDYHYSDIISNIGTAADTELRAFTFITDPQLGIINSPNGKLKFLQIVPITEDELAEIQGEAYESFMEKLKEQNSLFVTDLSRKSIL